jgi:hypothetical protein
MPKVAIIVTKFIGMQKCTKKRKEKVGKSAV